MQSNHVSHFWSTQPYHLWTNHSDHEASGPWLQKMPKPAPRVSTWIQEQFSSFVNQNWALWTWWRGRCWWWAGDKDDDSGTSHHHIPLALLVSSLPVCFHFVFWGLILHALFYYLCVFVLCRRFQSAISSSNWKLNMYVRMGYIILKKANKTPKQLEDAIGLNNMTAACWRGIIFWQFNDIAESLHINRFCFGFHVKARRGS